MQAIIQHTHTYTIAFEQPFADNGHSIEVIFNKNNKSIITICEKKSLLLGKISISVALPQSTGQKPLPKPSTDMLIFFETHFQSLAQCPYPSAVVQSTHHSRESKRRDKTSSSIVSNDLQNALTFATKLLAASSIPIFSLADVSNHETKFFSLQ